MAVIRKRLIFWLIKAYIKKSGKTLIFSFFLGLCIFFAIVFFSKYLTPLLAPFSKKEIIGMSGAYRQDNLPPEIVSKVSTGLTSLAPDGTIKPELASSWEIQENGKTYVFHLKQHQYFSDGKEVTSDAVNYNFSDVTTEKPDKYTVIFKLKDAYSPFLVTVSRPIFDNNYSGVGDYRLEAVKLNGSFIQSLTIASVKNRLDTIRYEFYPTEEALKIAFLFGEVTQAHGLKTDTYNKHSFAAFPNTLVKKETNHTSLVTLFFNTTDPTLSDKKLRIALSYELPDTFKEGTRAYLPYAPESVYYNQDIAEKKQDYEHAKALMQPAENASGSAQTQMSQTLTIKTLRKYRDAADAIAVSWKDIGITTNIEEVDSIPDTFQIFLGDFSLPKDPDQYTLWHSNQRNNITHYKNLRIDKLLEDGRKTIDSNERKRLYDDFQKYLQEDTPATFLYFPIEYTLVRK